MWRQSDLAGAPLCLKAPMCPTTQHALDSVRHGSRTRRLAAAGRRSTLIPTMPPKSRSSHRAARRTAPPPLPPASTKTRSPSAARARHAARGGGRIITAEDFPAACAALKEGLRTCAYVALAVAATHPPVHT